MKHKIISFMVLFAIGMNPLLFAQSKDLTQICYKEIETELISVPKELDLNTLTNLDKLHFKRRSITKQHNTFFDEKGKLNYEIGFLAQSNFYPPWYQAPSRMTINEEGTTMYFEPSSITATSRSINTDARKSLSGTDSNIYSVDKNSGEKYLMSPHTPQSGSAYLDLVYKASAEGLLRQFTFTLPSESELDQFRQEGLTVVRNPNEIKVTGNDLTTIWDLDRLSVLKEQNLDDGTSIITQLLYGKVEGFDGALLKKSITKVPDTFMNGDSFIRLSIRTYSGYSSHCSKEINPEIEASLDGTQLSIFPNPSSDQLTIDLPSGRDKTKLSIMDVTGQLIKSRNISENKRQFTLVVKDMPQGIYLIKVEKGETIYTSKFIKQ